MTTGNSLIEALKHHEGFRSKPYQCTSGVWTIGYGFTYLTRDESDVVLYMRVKQIKQQLASSIHNLSMARQDVIVNMAFNLGINGLMNFKKMWAAIHRKDFDRAADEMLDSKWASQVGERAKSLSEQMRTG